MAVTVRVGTAGGAMVRRELQEIGRTGEEAFERMRRSGAKVNPVLRGISATVNDAQGALAGFAGRAGFAGQALSNFGPAGVAAGAALAGITAGLAKALDASADFEAAMVNLQAAAQATGEQVAPVGELARRLGVQYGVGAKAVAEATDELLRAGVSIEDALGGAAEGALLLARATGSDTAQGVSVAVQAMQLFGLEAGRLSDVANQATGVINQTKQSLDDYALALGQGGAQAKAAGLSFEDYNAALAATASAFSSGSSQGTSFKVFLQRLRPQSKEAAEAMQQLGFDAFDASGKLKSIDEIAQDLARSLQGLTDRDRTDVLTRIFGTDAATFAVALGKNADQVKRLRDELIPATDAAAQAAGRMEGLRGAQARATAAAQELGIAIGEAGLTKTVTGLTEVAAAATLALAELFGSDARIAVSSTEELERRLKSLRREIESFSLRTPEDFGRRLLGVVVPTGSRSGLIEREQAVQAELRRRQEAGARADVRITQASQAVQAAAAPGRDLQAEAAASERATKAQTDAERERAEALRRLEQALRSVETPLEEYRRRTEELAQLQQQFPESADGLSRVARENAEDFLRAAGEAAGLKDALDGLDAEARAAALDAYGQAVQQLAQELASGARTAEDAAAALSRAAETARRVGEGAGLGREQQRAIDDYLGEISSESEQWIADAEQWRDTILEGAAGLVDGLVRGIAEGRKLKDIAADIAGQFLSFATNLAFSALGGGGGGGGGFSGLAAAFAGGRAGGGPTRAGFRYDLAEDGRPELLMLGGKGEVFSAARAVQMLQQAAGGGAASAAQAGRLQIVLRDETQGRIETRRENEGGDVERLVLLVRRVNEQDFASGRYDPQFRGRYGLSPRAAR